MNQFKSNSVNFSSSLTPCSKIPTLHCDIFSAKSSNQIEKLEIKRIEMTKLPSDSVFKKKLEKRNVNINIEGDSSKDNKEIVKSCFSIGKSNYNESTINFFLSSSIGIYSFNLFLELSNNSKNKTQSLKANNFNNNYNFLSKKPFKKSETSNFGDKKKQLDLKRQLLNTEENEYLDTKSSYRCSDKNSLLVLEEDSPVSK